LLHLVGLRCSLVLLLLHRLLLALIVVVLLPLGRIIRHTGLLILLVVSLGWCTLVLSTPCALIVLAWLIASTVIRIEVIDRVT